MFAGLCNGAKSEQSFISCKISVVITTESEKFSHQCTILCHTASMSFRSEMIAFFHVVKKPMASCNASLCHTKYLFILVFFQLALYDMFHHSIPILSTSPVASDIFFGISKSSYFNDELPEFITNIFIISLF
jgi:hypothetical protein